MPRAVEHRGEMTRQIMRTLVACGVTLSALGCTDGGSRGVEVGQEVPEYGALTLAGDSIHLADLRDEVVLLNIWATWCPPCREEIPALQALHEEHSDEGLHIVGVSVDAAHDRENVRAFAGEYGVTYSVWRDPADLIRTRFLVTGVPTTLLIGRDGTILWRHIGPVTTDDPALNQAIDSALGVQPT